MANDIRLLIEARQIHYLVKAKVSLQIPALCLVITHNLSHPFCLAVLVSTIYDS